MLANYSQMKLSQYRSLYDVIIAEDHILRKIKDNIDFSFVNPMLKEQYCEFFGRPAKEPEMMFKLLFLKKLYDLSDVSLIQNAEVNMAYKYFLDLNPEDKLVDPSLLTKFRKTRITEDILEEMLKETISQAIEKGLIKSTAIIVDSTHTTAAVKPVSPTQVLRTLTKQLRREIYQSMYDLSAKFPDKPDETEDLKTEIEYSRKLLENIGQEIMAGGESKALALFKQVSELLDDEQIQSIRSKDDKDARYGYKTPTNGFYGYKNHIAMTEERMISSVEITGGEAFDGAEMEKLVEKSKKNGIKVTDVIGDMAYSTKDNIAYCEKNEILLISKSNPGITNAAKRKDDGFDYNKDAGMMQCPAGELAIRKEKRVNSHGNPFVTYHFNSVKCGKCSLNDTCKVGQSKTKTFSITPLTEKNEARFEFEESEYFSAKMRGRFKIEEKNGELKQAHGLRRADSTGLEAMRLQTYFTAFTVNIKRMMKLIDKMTA